MTPQSVLVIGASGRTGGYIVKALAASKASKSNQTRIYAFCRDPTKLSVETKGWCDGVVSGDARKSDDIARAVQETDADLIIVSVGNGDDTTLTFCVPDDADQLLVRWFRGSPGGCSGGESGLASGWRANLVARRRRGLGAGQLVGCRRCGGRRAGVNQMRHSQAIDLCIDDFCGRIDALVVCRIGSVATADQAALTVEQSSAAASDGWGAFDLHIGCAHEPIDVADAGIAPRGVFAMVAAKAKGRLPDLQSLVARQDGDGLDCHRQLHAQQSDVLVLRLEVD